MRTRRLLRTSPRGLVEVGLTIVLTTVTRSLLTYD
jgi:hypothetical protein